MGLTLSSVAATGKIICMLGSWNPPRLARLQTHETEITRLSRAPLSIIEARRRRSNSIRLLHLSVVYRRLSVCVCGAFDTRLALRNKVKKNCPLFVLLLLQTEKSQTFGGPAIIRHNHYSGVCSYTRTKVSYNFWQQLARTSTMCCVYFVSWLAIQSETNTIRWRKIDL